MAFRKYAEKLDNYFQRLADGKAKKIKPSHVEKVIAKLKSKEAELVGQLEQTNKPDKKERLDRKLLIAREHIARAELLLDEIQPTEA